MKWNGMECANGTCGGMEWNGMRERGRVAEWNEMEWNGMRKRTCGGMKCANGRVAEWNARTGRVAE